MVSSIIADGDHGTIDPHPIVVKDKTSCLSYASPISNRWRPKTGRLKCLLRTDSRRGSSMVRWGRDHVSKTGDRALTASRPATSRSTPGRRQRRSRRNCTCDDSFSTAERQLAYITSRGIKTLIKIGVVFDISKSIIRFVSGGTTIQA